MYSRSHILIQNEITEAELDKKVTITKVNDDNIFELVASIEGLPQTHWQNGIFQIFLKFTENYNNEPPSVFFQTIPYHPNIEMSTGRPSIDFLDNKHKWKSDYNIKYILTKLQNLLAYPMLDRAVNMDAVFLLKGNPSQYENIIKQSVIATQRISRAWDQTLTNRSNTTSVNSLHSESKSRPKSSVAFEKQSYDIDLIKYFENENSEPEVVKNNKLFRKYPLFTLEDEIIKKIPNKSATKSYDKWTSKSNNESQLKNISFDDYCTLWKGIATSKASKDDENVYLKTGLLENPNLLSQHLSISIKELEEQVYQQLNEHKSIMYGKFDFSNRSLKAFEKNALANKAEYMYEAPKINEQPVSYNELKNSPNNLAHSINQNTNNDNHEALNKSQQKSGRSNRTEYDVNDDFDEEEVDQLINWTKNIVS